MKELSATTLANGYSYPYTSTYTTPSGAQGTTKVFFTRNIDLRNTIYSLQYMTDTKSKGGVGSGCGDVGEGGK